MSKDELIGLRKELFDQAKDMRHAGDYGAGAAWSRKNTETLLALIDHLLERMR